MRGREGVIHQGTRGSLRGHTRILEGMQTPCSPFLKENDPSLIKCESVGRIRMWPTTHKLIELSDTEHYMISYHLEILGKGKEL